jgi:hypothetical protein
MGVGSSAVIRAIVISVAAVAVGALIAGRFGAVLVGGMALWGHGAYALPALLERRRRRRRLFCARRPQQLR